MKPSWATLETLREVYTEREYFAVFAKEYRSTRVPTPQEQDAILKTALRRMGPSPGNVADVLNQAIKAITKAWCKAHSLKPDPKSVLNVVSDLSDRSLEGP